MKLRKLEKGELVFILLLGIVSVVFSILSLQMFLKDPTVSSEGMVPLLTSSVMLIMSVLMLLEIRKCPKAFEKAVPLAQKAKEVWEFLFPGKVSLIVVYCLVYAVILSFAGFIISTFAFLAISMITLHREQKVKTLIISAGILVFILVIFEFVFKVILP